MCSFFSLKSFSIKIFSFLKDSKVLFSSSFLFCCSATSFLNELISDLLLLSMSLVLSISVNFLLFSIPTKSFFASILINSASNDWILSPIDIFFFCRVANTTLRLSRLSRIALTFKKASRLVSLILWPSTFCISTHFFHSTSRTCVYLSESMFKTRIFSSSSDLVTSYDFIFFTNWALASSNLDFSFSMSECLCSSLILVWISICCTFVRSFSKMDSSERILPVSSTNSCFFIFELCIDLINNDSRYFASSRSSSNCLILWPVSFSLTSIISSSRNSSTKQVTSRRNI
mmetsp:Transcript_6554/g.12337  ORF Transcript_6554/g.12337 Transcript_6554/m.12337 type:complete len:288 (-) Transcript_6554:12239-13102(-)